MVTSKLKQLLNWLFGVVNRTAKGTLWVAGTVVAVVAVSLIYVSMQFPTDREIRGCIITKLYAVNLCPSAKDYVKIDEISEMLQKSVVLTEDSGFFAHHGFDFQEMENSFRKNVKKGAFARGGSTITQQLAKNMFLSSEKTISRKLLEALITLRIEKVLKKKEILEKYLNIVQFGKNIFGVKQAAEKYFHKSPADLDLVESAFLTFLLPSPEKYSVSFEKQKLTPFAYGRIRQIIENLFRYERIGEVEYMAAMSELHSFLGGKPEDKTLSKDPENLLILEPEPDEKLPSEGPEEQGVQNE